MISVHVIGIGQSETKEILVSIVLNAQNLCREEPSAGRGAIYSWNFPMATREIRFTLH